ncbi:MAG: methylenetetrahydrofolate reductase C-terminal domain-containing protein [Saccharofermentanales bacterium]
MIVASQKPVTELIEKIGDIENLMIVGCGTCVTVCMAGGTRETEAMAELLNAYYKKEDMKVNICVHTIERQCDKEFIDELKGCIEMADVVLCMGCGVGVQSIAEAYPDIIITPGLNTQFFGTTLDIGKWGERCGGCGECVLDRFSGVCPIARCSKSLLNGPCGGSQNGKCEVDPQIDCGWQLIFDRAKRTGQLYKLLDIQDAKNWRTSRDGGPRKTIKEEFADA